MIRKIALCVATLVVFLAVAPNYVLIYLIDTSMSVFNWYDGVYEFNTKVPNYVEGNWQPIHNEMHKISSVGVGELPKNLIGGMYVRSGANPKCWPPGNRMRNHAFQGESMLHLLVSYLSIYHETTSLLICFKRFIHYTHNTIYNATCYVLGLSLPIPTRFFFQILGSVGITWT